MIARRYGRPGALAVAILMVISALALPSGASGTSARDAGSVLTIIDMYTVLGDEEWLSVSISSTGTLIVAEGASLATGHITIKDGSMIVSGGEVALQPSGAGQAAYIAGKAEDFIVNSSARLVLTGADGGNASMDASQGGDAFIDLSVTDQAVLEDSVILATGGRGFSNQTPWADHADIAGYIAAGGNASVKLSALESITVTGMRIVLEGGDGGKAADGQSPGGPYGGAGGGYSNGGNVSGRVGSGGNATLALEGSEVDLTDCTLSVTGGRGGRAGDGGGLLTTLDVSQLGAGGGGGYSGGKGGNYSTGSAGQPVTDVAAEPGGLVGDFVGAGGSATVSAAAGWLSVSRVDLGGTGGNGGDGGTGGGGNANCGGGGGGYGGGGGSGYNGSTSWTGNAADGGTVSGFVGSGGSISVRLEGTMDAAFSNLSMILVGGNGGRGGDGGTGGSSGAGGGGGYGGGGGGANSKSYGGYGRTLDAVGCGGNVSVVMQGGPMQIVGSRLIILGGNGGRGGTGGNGGTGGGGGGGGYGGGGGGRNNKGGPGGGEAGEFNGNGGDASLIIDSQSGPGGLVARRSNLFLLGGSGGDGGLAGSAGSNTGGGGGGYAGCGGSSVNQASMPNGAVGASVGSGADAIFRVVHPGPSLAASNSLDLNPGREGNGRTQGGLGNVGGAGTGLTTPRGGNVTAVVPECVALLLAPLQGEGFNAEPPTFVWEALMPSPTEDIVSDYSIQVDNNGDFSSPEVDTDVGGDTTFTSTKELTEGGTYWWRVQATYLTGKSYGWGPAWNFSLNLPPVYAKFITIASFPEDTDAVDLIDLNAHFTDDLYQDSLDYSVIYESDPNHIAARVDGHFLSFSTPTPDWFGQEKFAVRATDRLGLSVDSKQFIVKVSPVDDPPVVRPLPDLYVTEDTEHLYDLTPYVSDVDTPLDQLVVTSPDNRVTIEGLQLIIHFPPGAESDVLGIDVGDGALNTTAALVVHVTGENLPPVLATIPAITTDEGTRTQLELAGLVSDRETPAGDMLWSVTAMNAGDPPIFDVEMLQNGTARILPLADGYGQGSFDVAAVDGGGLAATGTVMVSVRPVNDAPVIAALPVPTIIVGDAGELNITPYLSDVDNPLQQLKIQTASPVASVDGVILRFTASPDAVGADHTISIPFNVSDEKSVTASTLVMGVMYPPVLLRTIPNLKLVEGGKKTLDLRSYASDNDTSPTALAWGISGGTGNHTAVMATPDSQFLVVTGLKPGKETVVLTLRDPDGNSVSQAVTITVEGKPASNAAFNGLVLRLAVWMVVFVIVVVAYLVLRRKKS